MFNHKHYVPILKGKAGELKALGTLSSPDKKRLTPLFEVTEPDWDYDADTPKKTIDEHLAKLPEQIARRWGTTSRIFVDLGIIDPADTMASGSHPVSHLFRELAHADVIAVPVTSPERDDMFQAAVAAEAATRGLGACFRVGGDVLDDPDLPAIITDMLGAVSLPPKDVDLVLDLRYIDPTWARRSAVLVAGLLHSLPHIPDWRTLTVASTAFPQSMMGVPVGVTKMPRAEWTMWQAIGAGRALPRRPSFGDYAISHPEGLDVDPRLMQASATIRYTIKDEWMILKGRGVRNVSAGGYQQFPALCKTLIKLPEFSGSSFSYGDKYIFDCAQGTVSNGNLTTWRHVGTDHHMTFVVKQLASLP
jgi:hypothetical protein